MRKLRPFCLSFRAKKRLKLEANVLLGDTVFFSMIRENCYLTHDDICKAMEFNNIDKLGFPVEGFQNYVIGYFLPKTAIQLMEEDQQRFLADKAK